MDRTWPLLKWILVLLCASIFPIALFWGLLTEGWNFDAEPPWAWAIIPLLPLANVILLSIPIERAAVATRLSLSIFALHAVIMLGLLLSGRWTSVAGTALLLDSFFLATLLLPALAGRSPGRFATATILWLSLLFGVGFPCVLAHGVVVAWRAETLADGRPYCIQYASQTDPFTYEPARTLFDLSALKMQARLMTGGSSWFHFQNHAVLMIDDDIRSFFNWSYGQEAFLNEVLNHNIRNGPEVVCRPERHFAKHLPIWRHEPIQIEMSISARHFLIPEAYRPRANGNRIIINAVPTDFVPYDRKQHYGPQFYWDIVVSDASSVDLSAILKRRLGSGAKPVEPQFGLNKTQLELKNFPNQRAAYILYTAPENTGRLTELIDCPPPVTRPSCRFQFVANDLVFGLSIPDPSQWQIIEQGLKKVFASFEQGQ
jgi:hypothetical protein